MCAAKCYMRYYITRRDVIYIVSLALVFRFRFIFVHFRSFLEHENSGEIIIHVELPDGNQITKFCRQVSKCSYHNY